MISRRDALPLPATTVVLGAVITFLLGHLFFGPPAILPGTFAGLFLMTLCWGVAKEVSPPHRPMIRHAIAWAMFWLVCSAGLVLLLVNMPGRSAKDVVPAIILASLLCLPLYGVTMGLLSVHRAFYRRFVCGGKRLPPSA